MTQDELLAALFPGGHDVRTANGILTGTGPLGGARATLVGIADATPLGIEGALDMAGAVLDAVARGDGAPILVAVDSGSQRMRRRDELLGLYEYLAHLAKALRLAEARGHPTLGLLYGRSAAGAFIATALAAGRLAALPGAHPTVMDLPSVARVTTLPLDRLQALAKDTPVFAPGLDNMLAVGAVATVLDPDRPLPEQVSDLLARDAAEDERDRLGRARGGRSRAAEVAARIVEAAGDA